MRTNRLRSHWAGDGVAFGAWLQVPSGFSAEIVANEGFDYAVVDLQHGMIGFQSCVELLQAISATSAVPLVRAQSNDAAEIMKVLDAGAYGVICPDVSSRSDCERFVSACRYPPRGSRGWGPTRALIYGGSDYFAEANSTIVAIALIETKEAVENIEDILSVEGLDAIYIGSADLAVALGHSPSLEIVKPDVMAAVTHVLAAAARRGIPSGVHCPSGESVRPWLAKGVKFCTLATDRLHLSTGSRRDLQAAKALCRENGSKA